MAKKETAEETPTPNLPVNIEDQIKKELAQQQGQLGALPSNKIGLKDKKFTLPDGQQSPGPMEVVILDFIWSLVHYPGVYNPSNPQKPDCFAIGRDNPSGGLLVPDSTVAKPYHENCKDCPKNQWKSDPQGNGKACKNQRRLILVPSNFTEESDALSLYVSPGGLKNFDAYVSRLKNEHGILPVQAITEISFDSNKSYPLLQFKFLSKHDQMNTAWALKERNQEMLLHKIEIDTEEKAA